MSSPQEHSRFQFAEVDRINDAIGLLRSLGISELDTAMQALEKARRAALGKLGLAKPRTSTLVRLLPGLSPGQISLFLDAERGWLVEAIKEPGAPPVYRYVGDDIASRLLVRDIDLELEEALLAPELDFIA